MPTFAQFRSPGARRIVIGTSIVVPILAAAVAVSISRYENALAKSSNALAARAEALQGREAEVAFWHERNEMSEFLLTRNREVLGELAQQAAIFDARSAGIERALRAEGAGQTLARERGLVAQARAAHEKLVAAFAAARLLADGAQGLERLDASSVVVEESLSNFLEISAGEVP